MLSIDIKLIILICDKNGAVVLNFTNYLIQRTDNNKKQNVNYERDILDAY